MAGATATMVMANSGTPREADLGAVHDEQTIILFDWDDTLLCSSFLAQHGLRLDSPDIPAAAAEALALLEKSVVALLERAMTLGTVLIVTNAETGWVELSARRFMPGVVAVLDQLRVVSARSSYEDQSQDPADWKIQAFTHELGRAKQGHVLDGTALNVISLGDSVHERKAVHKVTSALNNCLCKSVKFVERPSVEQLKRQVDLVRTCLGDVISHRGGLDLMLTISLLFQSGQGQ